MGELISVIVPVYNTGLYLRRCIESIVAQDYDNLEIIIVDDGSTDSDTVKLCDDLASEYDIVSIFHKTNGGQSTARNYGISVSKGEYIGFVDSDDVIDSNMYSSLYRSIVENNVKVAIGGIAIEKNSRVINRKSTTLSGVYNKMSLLHNFFLGHFHSSCTNLYSRDVFNIAVFPVNEINEDYMLNYHIFRNQESVYVDDRIYYHYIKREDSTTGAPVSIKFKSWISHTSEILGDFQGTILDEEARYQYIFSNIVLGNKCLLGLVSQENEDAEILYKLVTKNLSRSLKDVLSNKYIGVKNKLCGLFLGTLPRLYQIIVLLVLRFKK